MIDNCHMVSFRRIGADDGVLTPIEGGSELPFEIHRVYYITGVPQDRERGFHSHRKLEQVLLCANGAIKIRLKIPGAEEIVQLRENSEGLYIGHMVWREMFDFTPDAVLLVLASEHYSESDYIRDYQQYRREAEKYFGEGNREP